MKIRLISEYLLIILLLIPELVFLYDFFVLILNKLYNKTIIIVQYRKFNDSFLVDSISFEDHNSEYLSIYFFGRLKFKEENINLGEILSTCMILSVIFLRIAFIVFLFEYVKAIFKKSDFIDHERFFKKEHTQRFVLSTVNKKSIKNMKEMYNSGDEKISEMIILSLI